MTKKYFDDLPETFVSTSETTNLASKAGRADKLRKLASRLYRRDLTSDPENLARGGYATRFKVAGPGDLRSPDTGVVARISALNLKSQI